MEVIGVTHKGYASNSARAEEIRKIFSLPESTAGIELIRGLDLELSGLTYITGFSGAGKSSLLKAVSEKLGTPITTHPALDSNLTVVDCFDKSVEETILWLSRFGLGEARVLITPIGYLSVGQRERFKLAYWLAKRPSILILDEFLSSLDRTTARVIAFQFQKIVRPLGINCLVATAHGDLEDALYPDRTLWLDFEGSVTQRTAGAVGRLSEAAEVSITSGTIADFEELKRFHYRDHQVGEIQDVLGVVKATFRGRVVGVRVLTSVFPKGFERLPLFKEINSRAAVSSRVVVHPAFRGLGISKRLDGFSVLTPEIEKIFTHSALALYFPFDRAGGYVPTNHPFNERSEFHDEFERTVSKRARISADKLNDAAVCESKWKELEEDARIEIRRIASLILVHNDIGYVDYVCRELGIPVSSESQKMVQKLFTQIMDRIPSDDFWRVLSEAVYFPMLGLVARRAHKS